MIKSLTQLQNNNLTDVSKNNLKIISYNMWNKIRTKIDRYHNVAKFIKFNLKYGLVDFMLLQEVDLNLQDQNKYDYHKYESFCGQAQLLTYSKYKLKMMKFGCVSNESGRPFMILYSKRRNLILVNLHAPHQTFNTTITMIVNELNKLSFINSTTRIILGGDFNSKIENNIVIVNKHKFTLHNNNKIKTCCNSTGYDTYYRYESDHIFDSKGPLVSFEIASIDYPSSDHSPVIATLCL